MSSSGKEDHIINVIDCHHLKLPHHAMCERCQSGVDGWSCGRPWIYRKGKRGQYGTSKQHPKFMICWDHLCKFQPEMKPPQYYQNERILIQ